MALSMIKRRSKRLAYKSLLAYYSSHKEMWKYKKKFVELANEFSRCMGLDNPPAVSGLVLRKMGLQNVPRLCSE